MTTEKSREQFEAWANTHYVLSELHWEFEDDEYVEPEMQYAWEAWQASRAVVLVELPQGGYWMGYDNEHLMESRDVREAIEAAGIEVAP